MLVFSGADHTIIHDIAGATGFGTAVTGVGDADGDGYDDFAVGAQLYNGLAGQVAVYSGRYGDLLWARDGQQAPMALSSMLLARKWQQMPASAPAGGSPTSTAMAMTT